MFKSLTRCVTTTSTRNGVARSTRFTSTSTSTATATRPSRTCPACQAQLATVAPLCPSCSQLVPPPPSSTSHYSLLSLPRDPNPPYRLDLKQVKREFLRLQQQVHPDRFTGQGDDSDQDQWAKLWSARVNEAYKTLSHDRERAEYLLSLHGVTIGEADPVTDPELLLSILETREALEEAQTREQVELIRDENSRTMNEAVSNLVKAFDESDPPDLDWAKNLVIQLKYLDNVETVCREWTPGSSLEL